MPETAIGRDDRLAHLRRQVDAQTRGHIARRPALPFGVPALDIHLPARGLRGGALHEVGEAGASAEHAALAALFSAAVLGRLHGPVLWCLRHRDLFAPALVTVGLCPSRILIAETGSEAQVLPAMEEGLHTRGLCAVVGEVGRLGLLASHRLQLGAERTGVLVIAIRRHRLAAEREKAADEPGAALTRWRVSPQPGIGPPLPGLPNSTSCAVWAPTR